MRVLRSKGMTLIELLVTIVITSVLVVTVGSLMIRTYSSWLSESARIEIDNDVRYFEKSLGRTFRNSTTDLATLSQTTNPNDTVSFTSIESGAALVHDYKLEGKLLRHYTHFASGTTFETVANNVTLLEFSWVGMVTSTTCLKVNLQINKTLPGGGIYDTGILSFMFKSRNRGRGDRSDEHTK